MLILSLAICSHQFSGFSQYGNLDLTFDGDGKVITGAVGVLEIFRGIGLQSDGKIVAAGDSNGDFAVNRYNEDGSLDDTFDSDGQVITAVGSGTDKAYGMAIQSDGKIVLAGYAHVGATDDFAVVRYNTDGSLDNTFDSDGIVTTNIAGFDDYGSSIVIQADDKILVAGYGLTGANSDFVVVRYNSDGSLDNTFDADGIVTTSVGLSADECNGITLQSDGKIVVVGFSHDGTQTNFSTLRYNTDGSLDNTFYGDGSVVSPIAGSDSEIMSVAIQTDGRIVVGGRSYNGSDTDLAVGRYDTDGSFDNTFSGDGKVSVDIAGEYEYGYSVNIQPDGKILFAGTTVNPDFDIALLRFNVNGTLDNTFGSSGIVVTDMETGDDFAYAIAFQPDGKILVAGFSAVSGDNNFAIARYESGLVGTEELSNGVDLVDIYPNPSTGKFFILSRSAEVRRVEIRNTLGESLHMENILSSDNSPIELDLSKFQTGVYFVRVERSDGSSFTEAIARY